MSSSFLLYGANGYTGTLIAKLAVQQGFCPILAGRELKKVEPLSTELGLECRAFSLDDATALDQALADVTAVLNCAGPFSRTAKPIVAGCLLSKRHYLDITGELEVFEALAALDGEAKAAGVMLLPGVGFDVVLRSNTLSAEPPAEPSGIVSFISSKSFRTAFRITWFACRQTDLSASLEELAASHHHWQE